MVVGAIGCNPTSGSQSRLEDDPDFVRGKSRLARKNIDGAVLSFREASQTTRATPPPISNLG
ncbi:MAG: hypothetical protein Ct9H300mP32_3920 [Verrucomicrobiota bacterium]|nr:MAG: hypothetical protein Ct9H300mP32_3920 [Verrucomicrobiota bacterium]